MGIALPPPVKALNQKALSRMPQAAQTPADMSSLAGAISDYLRQHRFSFPVAPTVAVGDGAVNPTLAANGLTAPDPLGSTTGGNITISQRMANQPINGQSVMNMLHEVLHTTKTGGNASGATPDQQEATEAAVEGMTEDLAPGVMHYLRVDPNSGGSFPYSALVRNLRLASANATGGNWRTPAARAWRANYFLTSPDQRQLIPFQTKAPKQPQYAAAAARAVGK